MIRWIVLCLALTLLSHCRSAGESDAVTPSQQAQLLVGRAEDVWQEYPEQAQALLEEALRLDPFRGETHNNLGVLCFQQGDLHRAAQHLEQAQKLLPGQPDPHLNLGQVFEQAGRWEDARDCYQTACEIAPDHVGALQARARWAVIRAEEGVPLETWLQEIAVRGESPEWRAWAREQQEGSGSRN